MKKREQRYVVLGEHFYQPVRVGSHSRVSHIQTDPQGIDWNKVIAKECYLPQLKAGTLEAVSFDFYATMRRELRQIAPRESRKLSQALRERGVGDSYLHVLLPDLSKRDKEILVQAGKTAFQSEARKAPTWFWAAETALDMASLEVIADAGYKGVICAPEQLAGVGEADNKPVKVKLAKGREIILLGFDRPFSSQMAFAEKNNADVFAQQVVFPRMSQQPESRPLVGWTDGETFGHHAKQADIFLYYLVMHTLPNAGVSVIGINETTDVWERSDYHVGMLRERTAWSCPHGNLIRWHGACPCDGGYHGGWKTHFMNAVTSFNTQIDAVLDAQLNKRRWPKQLAQQFEKYLYHKGSRNSMQSLLAAKASALAAITSCGTFFESPETSGHINLLFIQQAVEHLKDAGFEQLAVQLHLQVRENLSKAINPITHTNLAQTFFTQ